MSQIRPVAEADSQPLELFLQRQHPSGKATEEGGEVQHSKRRQVFNGLREAEKAMRADSSLFATERCDSRTLKHESSGRK